jgi:hypothetical protein
MLRRALIALFIAACGDAGTPLADDTGIAAAVTGAADEGTATGDGSLASLDDSGGVTGAISDPWLGSEGGAASTSADGTTAGDSTGDDPLADCPRLRVMVPDGEVLNVRPDPSTAQEPVGSLSNGALVDTIAAVQGEVLDGVALWYEVSSLNVAGFVFSGFVTCTLDEPPPPPEGFFLPLECGKMAKVTQGNDGDVSHQGKDFYAFDFGLGLGTPLVAMADGVVHRIYDLTEPGDPCYDGGGPECGPYGNLVVVLHGDNTSSYYKHLSEVHVTLGQPVLRADLLGLSGTTGYSTGPHAHIMRQENCPENKCQSIPLEFIEAGVPVEGQVVVSMNCL